MCDREVWIYLAQLIEFSIYKSCKFEFFSFHFFRIKLFTSIQSDRSKIATASLPRVQPNNWTMEKSQLKNVKDLECPVCLNQQSGKKMSLLGLQIHCIEEHHGLFFSCSTCLRPFNSNQALVAHSKICAESEVNIEIYRWMEKSTFIMDDI